MEAYHEELVRMRRFESSVLSSALKSSILDANGRLLVDNGTENYHVKPCIF